MMKHGPFSRLTRVIPALALATALAACGVDGEPEPPTRTEFLPAGQIVVAQPN
jgi:hypothetical protein